MTSFAAGRAGSDQYAYLKWPGNGKPMALDVDNGSDGSIDQTLEVDDVTDTLKEE